MIFGTSVIDQRMLIKNQWCGPYSRACLQSSTSFVQDIRTCWPGFNALIYWLLLCLILAHCALFRFKEQTMQAFSSVAVVLPVNLYRMVLARDFLFLENHCSVKP